MKPYNNQVQTKPIKAHLFLLAVLLTVSFLLPGCNEELREQCKAEKTTCLESCLPEAEKEVRLTALRAEYEACKARCAAILQNNTPEELQEKAACEKTCLEISTEIVHIEQCEKRCQEAYLKCMGGADNPS